MKRLLFVVFSILSSCFWAKAEDERDLHLPLIQDEYLLKTLEQVATLQPGNRDFLLAQFLANESKKFRVGDLGMIRNMMQDLTDSQLAAVTGDSYKDPTISLILSILCGSLGIDRFYIGDTGQGIGKLLTLGGLGVWTIIDWFHIQEKTKINNYKAFATSCDTSKLFLE